MRNSHLEDLDADVHGVKAWCVEAQHVLPLDVESEVCKNCLPAGGWDGELALERAAISWPSSRAHLKREGKEK